ncbi:carbohydrate binding domain-containing protein [Cohnella faecalis]|uniref:Carbohydrate-binding protein n=1 Tax=Cohnella faecalis TaxID=2315694 RepID=A0A398CFD7_9BACL|nr:carbohydrate binding domain-containing protein [Cohnella faecalis]RIE01433.1 carbohydrate-binding protein [Cohnella faecalis]
MEWRETGEKGALPRGRASIARWIVVVMAVILLTGTWGGALPKAEASGTPTAYPLNRATGGTVTASGEYAIAGEVKENAFDNNLYAKWLVNSSTAWIEYHFPGAAAYAINSYTLTSANDYSERDPKNWTLKGSNDGTNWTLLDTRTNENFSRRFDTRTYEFTNATSYKHYRFDFENHSGGALQVAEIKLFDGSTRTYSAIQPTVTVSGENTPNEGKGNLTDDNSRTKWLTFSATGWVRLDYGQAITLDGYALISGNDAPERDPKSWTLKGSNDGSTWTTIDSQSNVTFLYRHQRNHFLVLNNTTAYRYYQFDFQSNGASILQLSDIDLSYQEDMWHEVNPIVEFQVQDTIGYGYLFEQAIPHPVENIQAIIREVCAQLYDNPGEMLRGPRKVKVTVVDSGVAGTSGTGSEALVAFGAGYMRDYTNNSGKPLREELFAVLYHELTHVYQYDDQRYGQIGYMIEGMASAMTYKAGIYDRYSYPTGGTWQDGYGNTANFFRWVDEHRHPGFLRELNASLNPFDGVDWTPSAIEQITGVDVTTLWNEYQSRLPELRDYDIVPPTVPAGLAYTSKTSTSVSLSWGASTDNFNVAGYTIYRDGAKVGTTTSTSYTATGLSSSTAYSFTVKAFDTEGLFSAASSALSVTTDSGNTVTVYYKQGYSTPYIHYRPAGGSWTTVPGVAMPASEVSGYNKITINIGTATQLEACFNNGSGTWDSNNGNNYFFPVGTSTYNAGTIVSGAPDSQAPTAPTNLTSTAKTDTTVSLSWTASTDNVGVTGYDIYQGTTKIGTSTTTSYTATGLSGNTAYSFTVKARDAAGNVSAASSALSVTTNPSVGNTVTIYYKRGFSTPYIHYRQANNAWTTTPGVAMSTSEVSGYNKITINIGSLTQLEACFNDGNGNWDSNYGSNYFFSTGTWTYNAGSITAGTP